MFQKRRQKQAGRDNARRDGRRRDDQRDCQDPRPRHFPANQQHFEIRRSRDRRNPSPPPQSKMICIGLRRRTAYKKGTTLAEPRREMPPSGNSQRGRGRNCIRNRNATINQKTKLEKERRTKANEKKTTLTMQLRRQRVKATPWCG